jgi:hypothetical protein
MAGGGLRRTRLRFLAHDLHRVYRVFAEPPSPGNSRLREAPARMRHLRQREKWRWSRRRFGPRVDEIAIRSPIFLLGTQGGGLTLLARVLKRHPTVVTVGGDSRQWTNHDELFHQLSRMRRLPPSLWGPKFRADLDHPLYGTWHTSVYASDALLPHYRQTAEQATEEEAQALMRLIREHIAAHGGDPARTRFLDKSQSTTVRVSFVAALLRDCAPHFVLVARSPYTMAQRSVSRQLPPRLPPLSRDDKLRLVSEHWANSYRCALEDAATTERFAVVRFEDFLASPEQEARHLCSLVGLTFDPELLPHAHQPLPRDTFPGDDKWFPLRAEEDGLLSDQEVAIVDERCGALAKALGYTPSATFPVDLDAIVRSPPS